MRKAHTKKLAGIVLLSALVLTGSEAYRIFQSIQDALTSGRSDLTDENVVTHIRTTLTPQERLKIRIVQDISDTRSVAEFRGSMFAATAGGLAEYSSDGVLRRHYTVLDGLPESDLVSLAAFQGKLFIGTRSSGLLEFDGSSFARYEWPDRDQQAVTSLLNDSGLRLLIGTFNGGLLSYSGGVFSERKADGGSILKITDLSAGASGPIVSTFDEGVWIADGAGWKHLSKASGLPSGRVLGAAFAGGRLLVATDLGPAECLGDGCFQRAGLAAASGIAAQRDSVILSRENGELYRLGKDLVQIGGPREQARNFRVVTSGERIYAVGSEGVYRLQGDRLVPFARKKERAPGNFVSSILPLKNGQVWIGNFRGGVDVIGPDGSLIGHVENDAVSEINYLTTGSDGRVLAATTRGVTAIDSSFRVAEESSAGPAEPVNHISNDVLSTARGLLLGRGANAKRLTAEHRLPGNSVYTSLKTGRSVLVGTLSGLARVRDARVVRTWKDSNSGLSTNWVTAIVEAGERVFIGTYGGGVFELSPSDEIRRITPQGQRSVVNLNALATDGERIFAGTMEGLAVLELLTGKWEIIAEGLPSQTVLSVACGGNSVFVGTTNGIAIIPVSEFGKPDGGRL
ncbi:MAG: hypothetical protein J5I65_07560 [Aridibacter famidurans]|nr:hypothetical protein [Aridibacter famidurans]